MLVAAKFGVLVLLQVPSQFVYIRLYILIYIPSAMHIRKMEIHADCYCDMVTVFMWGFMKTLAARQVLPPCPLFLPSYD